jgi:glycosyltransferase involved in cell wall biosynthesis
MIADNKPVAGSKAIRQVGFVYDGTAYGGVEVHVLMLLRHLDRSRYAPAVVISGYNYQFCPPRFIEEVKALDIPILTPPKPAKLRAFSFIKDVLEMRRLVKSAKIDVIHIHTSRLDGARRAILGARLAGVKAIIRSEHVPPSANAQFHSRYTIKPFDWLTSYVVVGSKACLEEQIALLRRDPRKVQLSYYGIEVSRFNPVHNLDKAKQALGLDPALPVVGTVARLAPEKGHRFLLDAAARVIQEYGPVNFLLVGNGPLEQELRQQVSNLGIAEYVHFAGFQPNTEPYIAAMDFAVMASLNEGISLAMLEYMAMGKAIVATREPSFVETVRDGESGLLVGLANSAALAQGILKLLRDPALRARMGQAGLEWVQGQFTIQHQVNQLTDFYDQALGVEKDNPVQQVDKIIAYH